MSWIYIDDAAAAVLAALERGRPGSAYNVVDDEPVTFRDFAGTIAEQFGTPRPRSVPMWVMRLVAPYLVTFLGATTMRASAERAKAELDWAPSVPTYREGIARAARERRGPASLTGTRRMVADGPRRRRRRSRPRQPDKPVNPDRRRTTCVPGEPGGKCYSGRGYPNRC